MTFERAILCLRGIVKRAADRSVYPRRFLVALPLRSAVPPSTPVRRSITAWRRNVTDPGRRLCERRLSRSVPAHDADCAVTCNASSHELHGPAFKLSSNCQDSDWHAASRGPSAIATKTLVWTESVRSPALFIATSRAFLQRRRLFRQHTGLILGVMRWLGEIDLCRCQRTHERYKAAEVRCYSGSQWRLHADEKKTTVRKNARFIFSITSLGGRRRIHPREPVVSCDQLATVVDKNLDTEA